MSRLAYRAIRHGFFTYLVQVSAAMLLVGSTLNGTYGNMRVYQGIERDSSYIPFGSLGERLDDQLPASVLVAPSPHPLVRINNRTDTIHEIFLLSAWLWRDTRRDVKGSRVIVCRSRVDS